MKNTKDVKAKRPPWIPVGVYRMAHLPIRPILKPYDWLNISSKSRSPILDKSTDPQLCTHIPDEIVVSKD
jgi:hypothetical protein